MSLQLKSLMIEGYECVTYAHDIAQDCGQGNPPFVLIQPIDGNDYKELEYALPYLIEHTDCSFLYVGIRIKKWFEELTAWAAPPLFGKTPFGEKANDTLLYIIDKLIPYLQRQYRLHRVTQYILGGYSLAGLFTLWAGCQTDLFSGIVSASPSVWYPNWNAYAKANKPLSSFIYLSLGDREAHSKTKILCTINERMEEYLAHLKATAIPHHFEWNEGNHFQENGIRTAKGFKDCMAYLSQPK